MKRNHVLAAVATGAFLFATSPADARTIFPAFGDSGVASFDDHCPAHQFLIGLDGQIGTWVTKVGIICSPILPDGTHGTKFYGPVHGSRGATPIEFSCPADSVVYGATIFVTGDYKLLQSVELNCGSMQADRQSLAEFEQSPGMTVSGAVHVTQSCPTGELGSGFNGHYGKDVNALGLDCAVRTRR